jgi:hypothetical protein
MRINIVQTNYDPTNIELLEEVLGDLEEGITCFPECFALGRSGVETLQYLNKVSDESKSIVEAVKKTGKNAILPLIEKHPVMRNRFYNYLWEARLKARAIDNQLFVVGVNRYGEIGNERYLGKSMVVSPRGEILYACKKGEEIASIELDLDGIIKERGSEPTFSEFEIVIYDKFMEHFKERGVGVHYVRNPNDKYYQITSKFKKSFSRVKDLRYN